MRFLKEYVKLLNILYAIYRYRYTDHSSSYITICYVMYLRYLQPSSWWVCVECMLNNEVIVSTQEPRGGEIIIALFSLHENVMS